MVSYERWDSLKDLTCEGGKPVIIPNQGDPMAVGVYQNRLKIGGVKLTGDGSPQGKTAYLTAPYVHPPHGLPDDYRGYPVATTAAADQWFAEYGESHQHQTNEIIHWICVPLIVTV